MARILVVHNILWSSYKAAVFSQFQKICNQNGDEFLVLHVATTASAQQLLGKPDRTTHAYNYKVLFDCSLEEVTFLRKAVAVCKNFVSFKPDIVVIAGYSEIYNWCALFISILKGIKRVTAFDSTERDKKRYFALELLKMLYIRRFDGALTYGKRSREYLIKLGMPSERISVRCQATNNFKVREIALNARARRRELLAKDCLRVCNFLFVGRLSEEKNLVMLIQAFQQLKERVPKAEEWGLCIVGDGRQRRQLESLIQNSGVRDVKLLGGQDWSTVPVYYGICDVLILPSVSEPWGAVVNEAMACGMPVLVSDACGAAHDLVDIGGNGYIFDPNSIEEIVEVMKRCVGNSDGLKRMGDLSSEIIANYTPENAATQMYEGLHAVSASVEQ